MRRVRSKSRVEERSRQHKRHRVVQPDRLVLFLDLKSNKVSPLATLASNPFPVLKRSLSGYYHSFVRTL
jgi:hypothetical protein